MSQSPQRIHFIAIGGSIMHSLAICLKEAGHHVTGSDDLFFEPSKSNLRNAGLLPIKEGWNPDAITQELDFIILGMHAKAGNPELDKAEKLGIKIFSFPEFIYEASKNKQRVVVGGSHGKTTITAMVMHVLKKLDKAFDYMVAAQLKGFDNMVKLSDAPVIIIEGDEYTTSATDSAPKFLKYKHHIGSISGIAWDHYNVYPTLNNYVKQFELFADATPQSGSLVFCENDHLVSEIVTGKERPDVAVLPYQAHDHVVRDGKTFLKVSEDEIPVHIFGDHNMQNLSCAHIILKRIGVTDDQFYQSIVSFKGAAKRMEIVGQNKDSIIYSDFAHAPSKLMATSTAVKNQFPNRKLVACLELHTFSSLNKEFIQQYENTFNSPDEAIIYINPEAILKKGLTTLNQDDLHRAFKRNDIIFFDNADEMEAHLMNHNWKNKNLIMMSSGNFGGLSLQKIKEHILN